MDFQKLDIEIDKLFENSGIPALSVIITDKDQNIYEKYLGFQNIENKTSFSKSSIVRIASMTKPITSLCVFQLIEKNLLSLETNLEEIDDRFKNVKIIKKDEYDNIHYIKSQNKIKIKHLLNHTSGYGYQFLNPEIKYLVDNNLLQDLMNDGDKFLDAPILFEPGTKWNYGIGLDILGHLIEKITNQKLENYMKENIFNLLNMNNTSFNLNNNDFENLAYVYTINKKKEIQIDNFFEELQNKRIKREFHAGGGGLFSTTQDYTKFMRVFLNNGFVNNHQIISKESIDKMTSNQIGDLLVKRTPSVDETLASTIKTNEEIEKKFGYGFMINNETTNEGRPKGSISWSGIFNTTFWIDFKNQIGCAVFMQNLPNINELTYEAFCEIENNIYQVIND